MDLSRGTVSYEGHDYHDWNDHVDESPQHLPSSVHMLEENVPLHDQPGRTNSRHYSDSERIGSSLKGLDNVNHEYPWRPGGFRRFPYLGYIPLFLSVACTGLAIFIILLSDGQLVNEWSGSNLAQPAVYLALTSTAANTLMMIAYAQGWVSFFWIQALKGNMPLSNIHYNWEAATSVWGSIKSLLRRRALRVSIVSILVAMTSSLRGPLIQQGSYILTREVSLPGTIALQVLPSIEAWDSESSDSPKLRIFLDVMREYQARTPIYMPGQDCTNCSLSVQGFGFKYVKTTDHSQTHQFFKRPPPNGTHDANGTFTYTAIFDVSTRAVDDTKYIEVEIIRKASNSCDAELFTTVHRLYPSTVKYNLFLEGQKATFLTNSSWQNDSVVQQLNLGPTAGGHKNWKLNYFGQIADLLWGAATYLTVAWGNIPVDEPKGTWMMTWNFTRPDPDDPEGKIRSWVDYRGATSFLYEQIPGDQSPCGPSFDDPTNDILNGFRELALRLSIREAIEKNKAAAAAGNGTEDNPAFVQKVDYKSHQLRTEYAVNTPVLSLAVFFSLLGPIAILFLFQGWHTLGRNFSFSPFELANALLLRSLPPSSSSRSTSSDDDSIFEQKQRQHQLASLLADCSSNASAEQMVDSLRQRAGTGGDGKNGTRTNEPVVQYGVLDGTGLLGFAISDANGVVHARKPRKGEML